MGALYLGVCYPTAEAAKKAICSNAGQLRLDGGDMHASGCVSTDFSLSTFDVATATNGALNAVHTFGYPEFLDCEHTFTSALILDWLAALLLVGATLWGMKQLYNLFSGRNDE